MGWQRTACKNRGRPQDSNPDGFRGGNAGPRVVAKTRTGDIESMNSLRTAGDAYLDGCYSSAEQDTHATDGGGRQHSFRRIPKTDAHAAPYAPRLRCTPSGS